MGLLLTVLNLSTFTRCGTSSHTCNSAHLPLKRESFSHGNLPIERKFLSSMSITILATCGTCTVAPSAGHAAPSSLHLWTTSHHIKETRHHTLTQKLKAQVYGSSPHLYDAQPFHFYPVRDFTL